MTDPNGNKLSKEEQDQIREVLGDEAADKYIGDDKEDRVGNDEVRWGW